ncbi:MAG: hypothetical protein D6729_11800, partial [Deltaproteobacteria bacterium]
MGGRLSGVGASATPRHDPIPSHTEDRSLKMPIEKGQPAPDFTLVDQDGNEHTLSQYRGKPVVLIFYPLDFSPVCSKEHACLVEDLSKFNELDAVVLGISVDSNWCHKAFAEAKGIR